MIQYRMTLPFHPLVNSWFTETYNKPTAVQEEAWPLIAKGKDILAIAPTGSGKTLTAFLFGLSRFIDGSWDTGKLCVLYVSPLKALNEDIRRNLIEPIEMLKQRAEAVYSAETRQGRGSPPDNPVFRIRVETRSGDTPQSERRRFLIHPPSILAVTPESLAILLLNPKGREILSHIKYLVVDEIHAIMGTKRGAFLSCQIDRLKRIIEKHNKNSESSRLFQRVALSATVNPPELAAEFAGITDKNGNKQRLAIVAPPAEKKINFTVEFPPEPDEVSVEGRFRYGPRYAVLVKYILEHIRILSEQQNEKRGSILVFTDSRRRAERITYLLNETAGTRLALCHHGSLSKEIRRDVEQSLVQGIVSCVVATSSLELGLDIGDIDEVILAGTPSSCTRTLQRIGRSGHGVGETSRGFLLPFHGMDLLLGAVMAGATAEREIEKTQPIKNPLDILSQTILALCTEEIFTSDDLYKVIRTFNVFSDMSRSSFDSVIAMLVGKYFPVLQKTKTPAKDANSVHDSIRLRELKPRLYQDIDGKLYPAEGTLAMLYSSGGVIPGRGLYSMRLSDGTKIGELDEEFVFERRTGDSFDFGARSWSIVEIGNEAIIVKPLNDAADFQPFWKADSSFRSTEICQRALNYFGEYNKNASLANRDCLSKDAITALENFLYRQQEAQGGIPLPDQKIIPVEIINDPSIRPDSFQIVFHSFRGGAVHYPLAMALSSIIEEKTGMRCEAVPDDNAVLLLLPRLSVQTYSGHSDPLPLIKDCINLLGSAGEKYFKTRLEASGIFGAAFREAAERSMILPRGMYGRRIPLWVVRQRAKRLFDRVASFGDFPVTTEAWRSCLADQFDMEGFRTLLDDIATGSVELKFFQKAGASPFAHDLSWKEINNFMYEYDERKDILGKVNTKSGIADKAISDALNNPLLRPMLKTNTVESFTARQRRELPGYAPENSQSLSQWVKDRIAIPLTDEWETLTTALPDELQQQLSEDPSLGNRLSTITLPGASMPIVTHAETSVLFEASTQASELLVHLSEWLCFEGPVVASKITEVFGCTVAEAEDALDSLVDTGELVKDVKLENCEETYYCNTENFELLLRLTRKKSRPQIKEQPASFLVPFIAMRQGLIAKTESNDNSFFDLETIPLSCYPAPVQLWETELFPARIPHYKPDKLDKMLENGQLIWFGAGNKMAAFSNPSELELTTIFDSDNMQNNTDSELSSLLIRICSSYRNYWEIKDTLENKLNKSFSNNEIITVLWDAVWQSKLSSDTWESIRQGIELGFTPETTGTNNNNSVPISKLPGIVPPYRNSRNIRERRLPHALKGKWRDGSPVPGRWFAMDTGYQNDQESGKPDVFEQLSSLEQDELNRDRVRLLLQRWGILCRPLLEMEGFFSWSQLLPAMRRMELSGELVTGRFFEGIPSLQFAVPSIALELEAAFFETAGDKAAPVYWMNAADPASPAGWNITGLDPRYPSRNSSSRMCFRGNDLVVVSCKNGRELNVFVKEDDPDINRVFAFLVFPRHRACHPAKNIALEIINGKPAAESPYAGILTEMGFISDRGKLLLW